MKGTALFATGVLFVLGGYVGGCLTVLLGGGTGADAVTGYLSGGGEVSWLRALESGPLYLLVLLFCGLFLFGWLFVYPLVGYKAYGYGYTAGVFLSALGVRGLLLLGFCLFPSALAECLLLVYGAKAAFPQSFALFSGFREGGACFFRELRPYLLRALVLFQCSSFVLLWEVFLFPNILGAIREML